MEGKSSSSKIAWYSRAYQWNNIFCAHILLFPSFSERDNLYLRTSTYIIMCNIFYNPISKLKRDLKFLKVASHFRTFRRSRHFCFPEFIITQGIQIFLSCRVLTPKLFHYLIITFIRGAPCIPQTRLKLKMFPPFLHSKSFLYFATCLWNKRGFPSKSRDFEYVRRIRVEPGRVMGRRLRGGRGLGRGQVTSLSSS